MLATAKNWPRRAPKACPAGSRTQCQAGGPLQRGNFNKVSGWPHAVRAIGVEGRHVHDLRHAGYHFAAASGAALKDLMARMGHDSERAALIYQHRARGSDEWITDAIEVHVQAEHGKGGDCCRPVRRREGVKGRFACTFTRHFTCTDRPAARSALDAVPEAYHNPAAVWWGALQLPRSSGTRWSSSNRSQVASVNSGGGIISLEGLFAQRGQPAFTHVSRYAGLSGSDRESPPPVARRSGPVLARRLSDTSVGRDQRHVGGSCAAYLRHSPA
jgi:hypothetical protein